MVLATCRTSSLPMQIQFHKVADLPVLSDELCLVACSVSNSGTGLFLFAALSADEQAMEQINGYGNGISYAWMSERRRSVLVELNEGGSSVFELPKLRLRLPLVDRFSDGRILVASSVSKWRGPNDFDRNAVVFDPATNSQSEMLLGDSIRSLFIDSIGRIWVSYIDVGVFGGLGWGHPGPKPVGASGLNCFAADGEVLWSFPGHEEYGGISDCYALNVREQTAAFYYYSQFPLCRVTGEFQMQFWDTGLSGCGSLAISDSFALFSGQYHDAEADGYLARLGAGKLEKLQKVEFVVPSTSITSSRQLLGRGAEMHYFDKTGWYKTTLVGGDVT